MKMIKKIEEMKTNYGISLADIARQAGVNYTPLYRYVTGYSNTYSYDNMVKVLDAIKIIELRFTDVAATLGILK